MKKKLISYLLVFAMVLTLLPTIAMAAGSSLQVSADSLSGEDTVTVTYTIPNSVEISTLELKISFDKTKLQATDVTWSTVSGFTAFVGSNADDANSNGYFAGSCFSSTFTDVTVPANQTLVTAVFKIKDGATPGSAQFTVDELVITNVSTIDKSTEAGATTTGAAVTVVSELTGDFPITITAPAKGATPQDTITEGTGYTGTITWDGSPSVFAPETPYSAKVELTAKTGYVFASEATASVAGSSSITEKTVAADGSKLSFKVSFPATLGADALGGTVSITGTAKYDETLTAYTSALDYGTASLGMLSYQWKRGGVDISGAESNTYKLTVDDIGKNITVEVKNSNNSGSVTSAAVGPVAKLVYTGSEAVQATVTETSNTVTVDNVQPGQEYAITEGSSEPTEGWQDGSEFTGLAANTAYTVYTRVKATATTEASASKTTSVTTKKLTQNITVPTGTVTVTYGNTFDLNDVCETNASGNVLTFALSSGTVPTGSIFTAGTGVIDATGATADGTFKVKVSAEAYGNYNAATEREVTISIEEKPAATVTSAPTAKTGLKYTGSAQELITAGTPSGGTMMYKVGSGSYSTDIPKEINANTYTVYYYVEGDENHSNSVAQHFDVEIAKKAVTVAPKNFTITKGSAIPTFDLAYTGLVNGDALTPNPVPTFTCYETGTTNVSTSTAAGTYTITWTNEIGTTFTGTGSGNYQVTTAPIGTLTIKNPSSGGGGYLPPVQKPTITSGEGVKVTLSADGTVATIKVDAGYELADVVLNGVSKGKVTEVKGLKTGDKLEVKTEKKPAEPTKEEVIATLADHKLAARSKVVTMKNGKKAVRITWYNQNGEMMEFDGVEIFRSTKKNSGFGKKPFFATKGESKGYYVNSKDVKVGTTYYYKVRGYVVIDGQKYYTDYSLKAIRTVK